MSELPKGWASTALEELCERIVDGSHNPPKATSVGKPMLSARNISDFQINFDEYRLISDDDFDIEHSRTRVEPGNVLLTIVGTIGRAAVVPERLQNFALQRSVAVLKPMDVDSHYMAYAISAPEIQRWLQEKAKGTAQKGVYLKTLGKAPLPIAPRPEQTRIVAKLEELLSDLDAGATELKTAQKKLQQYRQSLLKAAVEGALTASWREAQRAANTPLETGAQLLERILRERRARWEEKQLAKFKERSQNLPKDWQNKYPEPITPDTTGLPALPEGWVWASVDQLSPDDLANGRSVPTADEGAKVLRLTAIKDGMVDLQEFKLGSWSEEDAKPFAVTEGDLLIVRGNGSLHLVGRAGLVGSVGEQVAYPDTMIRLRIVESVVSPAWIGLIWDSHVVRAHLERQARTSAGIYKIAQPDIISAVVPVPSLLEQAQILDAFVLQLEQIAALQRALETSLKQSTAQRQNILRAAFAGQLVPQDPNDEPASVLLERIRAERATQAATKKPRGRKIGKAAA